MTLKTLTKALVACATLAAGVAQASVITFEGGLDPTFTYSGVDVATVPVATTSGYNNVAAATASTHVAFDPNAISPSDFFIAGPAATTFTLNSFVIGGAWGSQTLTIQGFNNGAMLFSSALAVSLTPVVFAPGWAGIDQLRIITGTDFVLSPLVVGLGNGQHWALDNLTINEAVVRVPEPATLALLALGLLGFALRTRVRSNAAR